MDINRLSPKDRKMLKKALENHETENNTEVKWARKPSCYLTKRIRRKHRTPHAEKIKKGYESVITTSSPNLPLWTEKYIKGELTKNQWSRMTPAVRLHLSRALKKFLKNKPTELAAAN